MILFQEWFDASGYPAEALPALREAWFAGAKSYSDPLPVQLSDAKDAARYRWIRKDFVTENMLGYQVFVALPAAPSLETFEQVLDEEMRSHEVGGGS